MNNKFHNDALKCFKAAEAQIQSLERGLEQGQEQKSSLTQHARPSSATPLRRLHSARTVGVGQHDATLRASQSTAALPSPSVSGESKGARRVTRRVGSPTC